MKLNDPPDDPSPLNRRIAQRVAQLRAAQGLSLERLAQRSGVSRSMISLVERGETSPTAVVLEKLSVGLGVPLASLFDPPPEGRAASPLARAAEQPAWRDPASGYLRRNVSPPGAGSPIRIVDVELPPGTRIGYDTAAREPRVHQQVWVLAGQVDLSVGDERQRLGAGDCWAFVLDRPVLFHNPGRRSARYAVVLASEGVTR